jgi:hypothetical protein
MCFLKVGRDECSPPWTNGARTRRSFRPAADTVGFVTLTRMSELGRQLGYAASGGVSAISTWHR